MNCPSCTTPLEPNARFCGVCGFRLQASRPAAGSQPAGGVTPPVAAPNRPQVRPQTPAAGVPGVKPNAQGSAPKPQRPAASKPRATKGDEMYLNQVLNNRFKVESKIGEGGFGAVYRGTQLATGRKVALKLLHPEMTKDENLVARFRREGMVLCNLRDAHTITTYDFDQTQDGTLYIAMELLEGKSLHQVFHEQAPLEWKRVFKIVGEMCSSLAEAHEQGIVHRDLKPENIYLEHRPGNPEFVKILDFGIAKVMRGDAIDPQSPQLTATGQTLGTLEYMSPEQLMGKPLDGRSDVYALGVLAYEMITGRLPFPDAKGPAGLITAQLKQTPQPPSVAYPKAGLPPEADRIILKCLEKDKNNRYADVTALAEALADMVAHASDAKQSSPAMSRNDLLETQRADMSGAGLAGGPMPMPPQMMQPMHGGFGPPNANASMSMGGPQFAPQAALQPLQAQPQAQPVYPPPQQAPQQQMQMQPPAAAIAPRAAGSKRWIWWVVGLLALGAAAGAILALVMGKH